MHYRRDRYGHSARVVRSPTCLVVIDDSGTVCGRRHYGLDMCSLHYKRWRKWGDPLATGDFLRPARGSYAAWRETETISFCGAHNRVRALWGSPKQYPCIECGKPASEWAYDGTDPTQRYGSVGSDPSAAWVFYSMYPEFYMPMCRPCHARRDGAIARMQLREIRLLMHETGFSMDDIDRLARANA